MRSLVIDVPIARRDLAAERLGASAHSAQPDQAIRSLLGTEADQGFSARILTPAEAVGPWGALQGEGACTAYQRLEWMESLETCLVGPSGATPLIVELAQAGRPLMLLPLALRQQRGHRLVEWLDLGVCDYAAPVLGAGVALSAAEMERAWAAILAVLPPTDLVRITRIPGEIFGRPNPLALLPGAKPIAMHSSGFVLEGDPATLLKRICQGSTYSDNARRTRRLRKAGEVRFVAAGTEAEVDAIFEALVRQRRARFREMGRFDLLGRPEVAAFYREAAKRNLANGFVRVFGISVDGEWIATSYGLVHGGAFHGILLAMAGEQWRSYAPGIMIATEIMVWARSEGLDYFDFTIGDLPYKHAFRPVPRPLYEIVAPRSLRGRVVMVAKRLRSRTKAWLQQRPAAFERLRAFRRRLRRLGKEA